MSCQNVALPGLFRVLCFNTLQNTCTNSTQNTGVSAELALAACHNRSSPFFLNTISISPHHSQEKRRTTAGQLLENHRWTSCSSRLHLGRKQRSATPEHVHEYVPTHGESEDSAGEVKRRARVRVCCQIALSTVHTPIATQPYPK